MIILSLAVLTVGGACRLAYAALSPLRRWCDPVIGRIRRVVEPIQTTPTAMLAPGLLLAQLIGLGLLVWRFQSIMNGLDSFLTRQSPGDLWGLGPQNHGDQNLLTILLPAYLLVFGVAWYWQFKRGRERNEPDGRTWAGIAVLAFSVVFFQVTPFRVMYQNKAERVAYKSERCYLVGQQTNEALLFCPQRASPPLDQIVNINDPDLRREGLYESIFSALNRQR
jgi:hypothetical protein